MPTEAEVMELARSMTKGLVEEITSFVTSYPLTLRATRHTGPFDDITSMGTPYRDPGYSYQVDEPVTRQDLARAIREKFLSPLPCEHDYEEVSSPTDFEGETYRCSKCGDRYRLYYEDMK